MIKLLNYAFGLSLLGFFFFSGYAYFGTEQHEGIESAEITCSPSVPQYKGHSPLKTLSWNVQFMAGRDALFWYDLPEGGKSPRQFAAPVTTETVKDTLSSVVHLIEREQPDVIFLQEVADHSSLGGNYPQSEQLIEQLKANYPCYSITPYWDSPFVPHPMIMGKTNLQLMVFSRFQIEKAKRHQLPRMPQSRLVKHFGIQRAILEVSMPLENQSTPIILMNTHLDAFAKEFDTMQRQVTYLKDQLSALNEHKQPWVLAGDLNLLPPDTLQTLHPDAQQAYNQTSEIKALLDQGYLFIPPIHLNPSDTSLRPWLTYQPNNPDIPYPDRVLDYILVPEFAIIKNAYVLNQESNRHSDHFAVVAEVSFSSYNTGSP